MSKNLKKSRPNRLATRHLRLPDCLPAYSPTYITNLAAIIAREGIKVPILIDEAGVIRSGMALYLAARHLGLKFVPVAWLDLPRVRRLKFRGAVL